MYLITKHGKEIKTPADFPLEPHWQIWLQDTYTPLSGYENEGHRSSPEIKWLCYAYLNHAEWHADYIRLETENRNPLSPWASRKVFLGFEASGRVETQVQLTIALRPRIPFKP